MSTFRLSVTRQLTVSKLSKILFSLSVLCISATAVHAGPVVWHKDFAAASRVASRSHKPLLVMVGANWCGYCTQMKQQTLTDPAVSKRIADDFVPVMIDADEQPELTQRLNAASLPTMLVMSSEARLLQRMTGFQSAAQLNGQLAAYHPTQPTRQFHPTRTSFWRTHSVSQATTPSR